MTHPSTTPASRGSRAAARSVRARIEPMTVRPLRDGRYVVETAGGTYVVDADDRTCTCPDHSIRHARCKHLRRVANDLTEGRLPRPDERTSACAVCGEGLFVPRFSPGPTLCGTHELDPGDLVQDRETGRLLVVVDATGERADDHLTDQGRLVAEYETNANYGAHEPVFRAVYLASLSPGDTDALGEAKRYSFPASRLRRVDRRGVDLSGRRLTGARSGVA